MAFTQTQLMNKSEKDNNATHDKNKWNWSDQKVLRKFDIFGSPFIPNHKVIHTNKNTVYSKKRRN